MIPRPIEDSHRISEAESTLVELINEKLDYQQEYFDTKDDTTIHISSTEIEQYASLWQWVRKSSFIAINVAASVGIIFYNKHAFQDEQLRGMPVTVVAIHSLFTAMVLKVASQAPFRLFEPVSTPLGSLLSLSLAFPIYVVLGLLSVTYNPVGIYQLGKVMNSPVVVVLNSLFFATTVSRPIIYSIVVMCAGVAATIHGGWESTTAWGLSLVAASTCAAALYQIGIGIKHKELGLTSPQLVYQQSRLSGFLLLFLIPLFDTFVSPFHLSGKALSALVGTGILAAIVNLSQFLVIESTSALTFNVASQLKTCFVLIIAWIIADKPPSMLDYAAVTVTMLGSAAYAYIALQERAKAATSNVQSKA